MASDASIKQKNDLQRSPLFSLYLIFLGLSSLGALIGAFFVWGVQAIDFGRYVLEGGNDPLLITVDIAIILLLIVPIVFAFWWLLSVIDTWQMNVAGYRNLLTINIGLVLVSAIIFENVLFTIIALIGTIILLALAHFIFYPAYRGMKIRDYFSDLRAIRVFWQIFFVAVILFVMKFLVLSVYQSLLNNNILPTFDFLFRRAGFGINQSPDWYSADSRYGDAFIVGVLNTLQVVSVGLVLATLLGVLLGVFLLSSNWLIKSISRVYVEILRNTPLLLQLIFWYFVFWLSLPSDNITLPNESVLIVALRYFVYLFALIGTLIYVWRFDAPSRLFNGFLTGFVIAEIAFFFSDSYFVIVILGLIGIASLVAANRGETVPRNYRGLASGMGAMLVIQLIGHIALDGLATANVIDNARFVFGEVMPIAIFGPNVFALPSIATTPNFLMFAGITLVGIVVAVALYIYWGRVIDRSGADIPRSAYSLGIVLLVAVVAWNIAARPIPDDLQITIGEGDSAETVPLSQVRDEELLDEDELVIYNTEQPMLVQTPQLNRFGSRVLVGSSFSPNFIALLVGLVIYTSAYIGEIVRAGIQAVPWGQVEAARALGLSQTQTLRMIILPQALRVILPPMGNQYLNLSKNSSLATAIAFSDTYQIGQTIMNQSGQSITGFALILAVYLIMSLIISFVMNTVNSRYQLVTR
ncbi:MAG: ABC transporter permease subunit [Chloroflexota bacterium]